MRCFIAVDVDDDVKAAVADLRRVLSRDVSVSRGAVTWVRPEAQHLTLRFLGEIPDTRVPALCRVAQTVAARHAPFTLGLTGVGHFGGRNARVLWLGVGEGLDRLTALHADLEDALDAAGWQREGRRFSAHLTLCRIKEPRAGRRLAAAAAAIGGYDAGAVPVERVTVYQSELRPGGPRYTVLGHADLGGA